MIWEHFSLKRAWIIVIAVGCLLAMVAIYAMCTVPQVLLIQRIGSPPSGEVAFHSWGQPAWIQDWLCPDGTYVSYAGFFWPVSDVTVYEMELSKSDFQQIAGFKRLESLYLGPQARFNASDICELGANTSLCEVVVRGEIYTDEALRCLSTIRSLDRIMLNDTGISPAGLKPLSALPRLRDLEVDVTDIDDVALVNMSLIPNLEELTLSPYALNVTKPLDIGGFRRLRKLRVYIAPLEVGASEWIGSLPIQVLDVSLSPVGDELLNAMGNMQRLEELDLGETRVTDAGLQSLIQLPRLRSISLWRTGVTDVGLVHIGQIKSLERLNLGETGVTDKGLEALRSLTQLKELVVTDSISESAVGEIKRALPGLTIKRRSR
jgi:hypothetical protein